MDYNTVQLSHGNYGLRNDMLPLFWYQDVTPFCRIECLLSACFVIQDPYLVLSRKLTSLYVINC